MNTTTNFINCVVCCCKHIYTPHQNFGYQYQTNIHSSSFFWLIFTNTSTQFISIVISHCKHIYTTLYSSFFFITNTSIHLLSIVLNNIKHIQGAIFFCYFFTNFRSFFWKYHDNTSQIMLLDFVFDKLLLKKNLKTLQKSRPSGRDFHHYDRPCWKEWLVAIAEEQISNILLQIFHFAVLLQ